MSRIQCPDCEGTGYNRMTPRMTCLTCGGQGHIISKEHSNSTDKIDEILSWPQDSMGPQLQIMSAQLLCLKIIVDMVNTLTNLAEKQRQSGPPSRMDPNNN